MSVRIMVGDCMKRLAELPDASVHCVITSPPYWGLRSYKGNAGMIGLEPTFDEHLENLVAVFREVWRVLRKDGVCFVNYGSAYWGVGRGKGSEGSKQRTSAGSLIDPIARGTETSQSHQHSHAPERGTSCTGLRDCQERDCVCSGLCGECQAALRGHWSRSDDTSRPLPGLAPSASASEDGKDHPDCSPPPPSQPDAPASNTPKSSPPLPGACSPERTPAASSSRSVERSEPHGAPRSACTGCCRDIPGTWPRSRPSGCHNGKYLLVSASGNYATRYFKPKDLMDMPGMVAEALRADGWWLRSEIIFHKPNPMPESCKDRPTSAHEKMFLLTKSARYFYDADAVRTAFSGETKALSFETMDYKRRDKYKTPDGWDTGEGAHGSVHRDGREKGKVRGHEHEREHEREHEGFRDKWDGMSKADQQAGGANLRNVWKIATHAYSEAHFATFPPDLVVPCIKAGTSEKGCCSKCGAPWVRETTEIFKRSQTTNNYVPKDGYDRGSNFRRDGVERGHVRTETTGWTATCEHFAEVEPCTVMDPFGGSGTVGLVAQRLQRNAIIIEISKEYAEMSQKRIAEDQPLFSDVTVE